VSVTGEKSIKDLINDIQKEQLILPEFQRGYVWKRPAVRSFITSLYRGYPTGSFLIWKTPDPGKVRKQDEPDTDKKFFELILDGQQRLTSVYAVITGGPPPFYEGDELSFDLYFNLLDETFSYWKKITMQGKPEWVAVTEFFKEGLGNFLNSRKDEEELGNLYLANVDKLNRLDRIRDYSYYMKTLDEANMDRVVEIFNLVNSAGTNLSKSDLALAHISASWPDAREIFKSAAAKFAEHGFTFELDFFTRTTSVVATKSALYEPLYRTPIKTVQESWKTVEQVLEYLVNVLRADAYIDSVKTLPSDYPLVPLVSYLATHDEHFSSAQEKRDFLHWFYAALMWGHYSGSAETKLNADVGVTEENDAPQALRAKLLQERGRIKVDPSDLARRGAASTFYPMTYIVMRSRGATDWFNGQPLYVKNVGALYGLERHHIFPQAVLYANGYSSSDSKHKALVNEIANSAFLTKAANLKISKSDPLAYLREIRKANPETLEAQFVPLNEDLWHVDRFEDFLKARRALIAEGINEFMDALLEEPAESGLTIDDLIAQGEGKTVEYKSSLRWDYRAGNVSKVVQKSVAKTMAAFLNTDGGTLLIGLTDEGEILGIAHDLKTLGRKPDRDGFELAFREVLSKYLGPATSTSVELTFTDKERKTLAVASCQPYPEPVYVTDGSDVDFFVRDGNSSKPLNVLESNRYIAKRWPQAQAA
jgi:hypothetical protein